MQITGGTWTVLNVSNDMRAWSCRQQTARIRIAYVAEEEITEMKYTLLLIKQPCNSLVQFNKCVHFSISILLSICITF